VARERFNAGRRRSERRRGAVSGQARPHDAGQTGGALARLCESLEIRAPDARKPPVRAWQSFAPHCIQNEAVKRNMIA
jgi:hypothetical protein